MESGLIATLFSLALIVGLFLLFRTVIWWYWGIDKALKNLENMQYQLEAINYSKKSETIQQRYKERKDRFRV